MSKKAFDKIATGLNEALNVAHGKAKPSKLSMRNVDDIIRKLPAERRAKIAARSTKLIGEELALRKPPRGPKNS